MMDDCDVMMECPYNKSHRVQKSRMQTHLFKCRKNYPHMELKRCPFNANHDLDPADLQQHIETCPDRGSVEAHLVQTASERKAVIMAYVPPIMPPEEENWDADAPVQTYDPSGKNSQEKILRGLQGASKSERKTHRAQERLRFVSVAQQGGITGAAGSSAAGTGTVAATEAAGTGAIPKTKPLPLAAQEVQGPSRRASFDHLTPLCKQLGTSATFAVPKVVEIPAKTLSLEETVLQLQAWGAKNSEQVASIGSQACGNLVAYTSVHEGRKPSNNNEDDFVPPEDNGSYRIRVSVDTGEGLPAPNLERNFPTMGRGRGRLP